MKSLQQKGDDQLYVEFPELRDFNSDLFKTTAIRFQEVVAKDPAAKDNHALLYRIIKETSQLLGEKCLKKKSKARVSVNPKSSAPRKKSACQTR